MPQDDPSMDDILASIRHALNEELPVSNAAQPPHALADDRDVFVLDQSMMMADAPAPKPAPAQAPAQPIAGAGLIAPATAAAAASSMGELVRRVTAERATPVARSSGPTIEDVVREEMRPVLKGWLDTHLPALVERLVKAEIEKVINRTMADI